MTKWNGHEPDPARNSRGVLVGAALGAVAWVCAIYLAAMVWSAGR